MLKFHSNVLYKFIYTCIALLCISSCKEAQKFSDIFTNPSPRELYARTFEKDTNYLKWQSAYQKALTDSLFIELPYAEAGTFASQLLPVYSYNVRLERGEILMVEGALDSSVVFIDIHHHPLEDLKKKPLLSDKLYRTSPITMAVKETGTYKIVIQPELYASTTFQMEIYTKPSLVFPVAGFSDKAIQSFWGNPRSGGTRVHEGIDIFAPRLTPVVAVTNGHITFKGDRGLGGKQVWLRDGLFGISYYYAHLDSIKVTTSNKVTVGDTLGYVGNSGNAKTTAPHLHFGIYTSQGAIDPFPFVRNRKRKNEKLSIPTEKGIVISKNAPIRMEPNSRSRQLATLKKQDTLYILGKAENWYHINSREDIKGFLPASIIKEIQ